MDMMTEVKTADLIGPALDWAVAQAAGWTASIQPVYTPSKTYYDIRSPSGLGLSPSKDWSQCGPLIERFRISIIYSDEVCDPCAWTDSTAAWHATSPIVAACRAIVAAKLGDTVSIPAELVKP